MMKKCFLFSVIGLLLFSCSESDLAENVRETLYVRNKGADIPAHIYGNSLSKTFVVFVHGGPGGSGIEYRGYYSEELEKDYAIVYTDQRGQGTSHGHYSNNDVTISLLSEDLYVLVRALKARYGEDISVFMMGHSWGGTLGTAYVLNAEYRKELAGWIEVDGAHDIPMLNRAAIAMFKSIGIEEKALGNHIDEWKEILDFANGVDTLNISDEESSEINKKAYTAEGLIDNIVGSQASNYPLAPLYVNHVFTSFYSGGITANQLNDEIEASSFTSRLNEIDIPTLLLWGKYDFVVSPRLGRKALTEIGSQNKHLVIFKNSGHSPMDSEADLFIASMKTFIERWK